MSLRVGAGRGRGPLGACWVALALAGAAIAVGCGAETDVVDVDNPLSRPDSGPRAGNANGRCAIPVEAGPEDVSQPTTVVGNGTEPSCTGDAFADAVARGGLITFDCGPDPITIRLGRTAKIRNDTGPRIVIDGGGKITLDGGNRIRILYMNTCDSDQVWTTPHCQDQDHPTLTVQNLTFVRGNAKGLEPDGGGAIFSRGGRLKIVNCRFFNNTCDDSGPDVGGAAVRAFDQHRDRPLYVVNSTFGGGDGYGNVCSNGAGISSIGVSYTVINSLFTHNRAVGRGRNPAQTGTPGGGSGGAIYNDGNTFTLTVCGTEISDNEARELGGAIFFVSNDRSGRLIIRESTLRNNPSAGAPYEDHPGIFAIAQGEPEIIDSLLE